MRKPSFIFRFLSQFLKLFLKKPNIIDFNEALPKKALFIGNHAAIQGPLYLTLFFPYQFVPWGTHEMTRKFKDRCQYLYHVIYRKKLKRGKLISSFLSVFFATFASFLYRNVNLIPTYPDVRLKKTFEQSRKVLNHDQALLIFPEDSEDGYHEMMQTYYRGFLAMHRYYFHKEGIDLPIVPYYYDKKSKTILIGKPLYYKTLKSLCESESSMLKLIVNSTNALRLHLKPRSN